MKQIVVITLIFLGFSSFSQQITESGLKAKNYVTSEYNRNSLTIAGLDFNENLSSELITKVSNVAVPDKYYDNPLQNRVLLPGVARETASDLMNFLDEKKIQEWLNANQVGQQILGTWFNRQADGTMNVDILKKRGLFNADDNEFIISSTSKRGDASLMDMGLQLVNQSYVLLVDFVNIMTMEQYYEKNEVEASKRNQNGYRATLKGYLFKLDFSDSLAAVFFQNFWIGEDTPDKAARMEALRNARFPFVLMSKHHYEVSATQYNPGQSLAPKEQKSGSQLMEDMVKSAMESLYTGIENQNEAFRVKAMVSDVKPIAAKIGKKEGLKFDQRYFVFENRTTKNGAIYSKRKAVVKSMSVADNRQVTSGQTNPSHFYQIAGGRVDNFGMFLEQHNDVGLNLFLGATQGGLPGATGRLEYFISKIMGEMVPAGTVARGLTSIKLYVEGAYGEDAYELDELVEDFTFIRGSVGLAKDFYPVSFLHWGPFIGYGLESASWEGSENSVSTDFVEMGARIGLNVSHNIQLMASANYYVMISSEVMDENNEVINGDFDYKGTFEDRFGPGVSLGLRIMF